MLQTFIITILIILGCIFLMSISYMLSGKKMSGSCGNSKENPCDCSIVDKIKCSLKKQ